MLCKVDWDTDGKTVDLPTLVKVPDDVEDVADYLSDKYGWCVSGYVPLDIADLMQMVADSDRDSPTTEDVQAYNELFEYGLTPKFIYRETQQMRAEKDIIAAYGSEAEESTETFWNNIHKDM